MAPVQPVQLTLSLPLLTPLWEPFPEENRRLCGPLLSQLLYQVMTAEARERSARDEREDS